ncbi:MAG TPA: AAA family ATPase [Vicinamibacteria bacterium]|nr:AAA family ATPase [Vicinamibacteria bacterium]
MYEAFYGFREKPFNLTPDPKFLYLSGKHNEAFAHLEFGLRQRGGFIVVTGEVGTGKTTLCRYFLERLDESTFSAFILYPALGTTELLRSVNRDLGIARDPSGKQSDKDLIDDLHQFLLRARARGKNTVLVIDEAQNLSRDVLEQVRLISNLETAKEKLIQIVLIGQPELNDLLAQRDLRQLAQRITARYHLNPLGQEEMTQYIRHRLAVAGGIGRVHFTNGAISRIHRYSSGVPRLINLVCDRSLLAGFVLEKGRIDRSVVRRAVKELGSAPVSSERGLRRLLPFGARTAWLALAALIGLGAVYLARAGVLRRGASMAARPAVEMSAEDVDELFELRLAGLSPSASRRAASTVLLEQWGIRSDSGLDNSEPEAMSALAERQSLQYAELETSLGQLRAFDLPAVLEMVPPSGGDVRFLTLTGLDADSAIVHFGPGEFFRVPTPVLSRFWNGRARVFWRDFDELEGSDVPQRLAWAGARLAMLGMLPSTSNPTPGELLDAVKRLQEQLHLQPDGNLGAMTRMALYSLSGGYSVPRLREP